MKNIILLIAIIFTSQSEGNIFAKEPASQDIPRDSTADIIFECRAGDELTNPKYSWLKENTELLMEDRFNVYNGDLYISRPQESDAGSYKCVIKCDEGNVSSNPAELKFQYLDATSSNSKIEITTSEGVGVMLQCGNFNYAPAHSVQYMWEDPGDLSRIKPTGTSTHMVSQYTGNLYLANPKVADSRIWDCEAMSRWKINDNKVIKYANTVELLVTESDATFEPLFMVEPKPITYAELHGETYIECFASGNPTPEIVWTKDGGKLPASAEISDAGQLYFQNVPEDAEGTYTCTVSNTASTGVHTKTSSGKLELQYPPLWTTQIHSKSLDRSNTLVWHCSAKAAPLPSYVWYKNGVELSNGEKTIIEFIGTFTRLTITDLQGEDAGLYQCVATNTFGESVSNAELEVKSYPPKIDPELPSVINGALGAVVMIECPHTAAPAPNVTWIKNEFDIIEEGTKFMIVENGTLVINLVTVEDEGSYTCKLENLLGSDESTGNLRTYEPTIITEAPTDVSTTAGMKGTLLCEATWDARLSVNWEWYHGEDKIIDDYREEYILQGGEITIKSASSKTSGKYTCCVISNVGDPCASAYLYVTAPPNPPTDLTATTTTSTTHDLSWTAPFDNHSPITQYVVQLKNSYDEEWMDAHTEPSVVVDPECKVIHLLPYNDYSYRVYAINDLGDGEPSEQSNMYQTSPAAPVKAPHRLRGGGGDIGQLVVQWKPLSEEYYGDDTVGYVVAAQKIPKGEGVILPLPIPENTTDENTIDMSEEYWTLTTINDGKRSNLTLSVGEDEVWAPYNVRIKATNKWGEGPWSPIKLAHTFEIKPVTKPNMLRTQSPPQAYQADIIWDRLSSKNGRVTSYKVKIEPKAAAPEDSEQILETKTKIPFIRVKKLTSNAVYNVYVAACNSAGQGPWSDALVMTTSKKPPSKAPRSVKIHVKDLILTAEWDPIVYEQGEKMDEAVLVGYKIQYWHSNKTSATALTEQTINNKLSFSIANNSLFNAWVRGYSAGGDGTPSQVFYISTQSVALPGYIHCCGANTITYSSMMVGLLTLLWGLFFKFGY